MKVLSEDSKNITVNFSKTEFYAIKNFFLSQKKSDIENFQGKEMAQTLEDFINLSNTEKGLFDEIDRMLSQQ